MLIRIDPERQQATQIPGRAHIIVAVLPDGTLHLSAIRQGRFNASYINKSDAVLLEIPKLLAELRAELASQDDLSGSAVTE